MVEMKFNSYKIIPHYCNNRFAFHMHTFNIYALILMGLEILSFAINHYATGMQLVVICNYLGHVCNYKFGIV
jgi:hypothetical protein